MQRDAPTDAAGFSDHYRELASALRAWAVLQVKGPLAGVIEPDDLVQEVCVQAFAAYSRFDPARGSFRAWLFGVAHKVLRHALRSVVRARARGAAAAVPLASRAGELPAEATTVSRRVARDEGLRRFLEHAAGLAEVDQQLLVWRGLEGLSHEQVGELLGVGAEGARKRWQRLRARLAAWPGAAGLVQGG